MKTIFNKLGGEIGKTGCVSYLFDRKGLFVLDGSCDEEKVTEIALESGAEDVEPTDDEKLQVICSPDAYQQLVDAFEAAEITPEISQVTRHRFDHGRSGRRYRKEGAPFAGESRRTRRCSKCQHESRRSASHWSIRWKGYDDVPSTTEDDGIVEAPSENSQKTWPVSASTAETPSED